ncbi:MAG: hypothetical protein K2G44_06980 [Clostridia bacterium]|nr:hypothetical protein [Clostridia bacterium]
MRKFAKKTFCLLTAAAVTAGALSLVACGKGIDPITPDTSTGVTSNGGFVVATDKYYYFINGQQDYSADNTYGDVVKGALMRVSKEDVQKKENNAETVVPSLMVAGDTSAGIFIYGERIYYATPNNVKSTTGEIENDYLDFKSVKTDGTGITDILRLSNKDTKYRFVEVGDTVYLVYVDGTDLHSYNTAANTDTVLVKGGTYVFNDTDKSDPYIYYTMSVSDKLDSNNPVSYKYNQIYRVCADATEDPYGYEWDKEWLDEHNGEAPYVNFGTLVLDGISKTDLGMTDGKNEPTQFNHDVAEGMKNCPEFGYTYTLQNYVNGGIYYKRTNLDNVTEDMLYYLPVSAIEADGWNTVEGNDGRDVIANNVNLSKATATSLYYIDGAEHHYLYVSGNYIHRADVDTKDGKIKKDIEVAYDASGATLVSLDTTSSEEYKYVYYTRTSNGALTVERAVINGEKENYSNLSPDGVDNTAFEEVKLLDVQHASGWYSYEIIEGNLFYANAESFGESLNYVYTVNLTSGDKLMNNNEIRELNEKYKSIFDSDKKVGYLEEVKAGEGGSNVADALKYYFYTGETKLVWENIQDALDAGKKESYVYKNLYSEKQQEMIKAFTAEDSAERAERFTDENGKDYFTQSYFTNMLGKMSEQDAETYNDYWKTSVLQKYTPPAEEEKDGLAWWAIMLIVIAAVAACAGIGVGVYFYLKKHKKEAPKVERMRVDTTDDKNVDVYNMNAEPAEETPAEEAVETAEPAEALVEETAEEAEPAEAEPAEAETSEAEPAELPAEDEQNGNDPYNE